MKILYVTTAELEYNDAPAYHVAGFCNALCALGHTVGIIFPIRTRFARIPLTASVQAFPIWIPKFRGAMRLMGLLLGLRLLQRGFRYYDVVYVRVAPHEQVLRHLTKLKVPIVFELIGLDYAFHPVYKKFAPHFAMICADFTSAIPQVAEAWVLPAHRFLLSQIGVSPECFPKDDTVIPGMQRRFGITADMVNIVHVSSFRPHHDFETIIAAVEKLDFKCRVVFVGDGMRKKEVELLAGRMESRLSFPARCLWRMLPR